MNRPRQRATRTTLRRPRQVDRAGGAPATIHDVAARAGVSIKTVSRVVNREPNVRENMTRRVQEAIFELNYRPNAFAGNLSARTTKLIGLVYDNPSDSYLVAIQDGALRACRRLGYSLTLQPAAFESAAIIDELLGVVRERRPTGLILTPPLSDATAVLDALDHANIDYVRIGSADETRTGPLVNADDRQGARDIVSHLIERGHVRIGFIGGHPSHRAAATRHEGFLQAHREHGVAVEDNLITQGLFSFESGIECARVLLNRREPPTAIFAANDDMACAVLHAAYELGLRVPADLSVAGFDDLPIARRVWPSLTTVRQPFRTMAEEAVNALIEAVDARRHGRPAVERKPLMRSELIIRQSTGAPRTAPRA